MKKLLLWRFLILPTGYAAELAAAVFAVYLLKTTPQAGLVVGAVTGMITAAVLYFLAGFKNHKANILKIALSYFLWTIAVFAMSFVLKTRFLSLIMGGFLLFAQINFLIPTDAEVFFSVLAFVSEIIFLSLGIFSGRHKEKKILSENAAE